LSSEVVDGTADPVNNRL